MSEDPLPPTNPDGLTRRDALRGLGVGGAALGAGFLGGALAIPSDQTGAATQDHYGVIGSSPTGPGYHGMFEPPAHLNADSLDALTIPPQPYETPPGSVRRFEFVVTEQHTEIAAGLRHHQWTYNGTAPGPIIRATEGDRIEVRLINATQRPHNLHFHGRHSPFMDGWEPIPPGEEFVYEIEAGPAGVHPYHCHTMPLAMHIARGLYGTLIVDPAGGREPAHEFVLLLSGWDLEDRGRNDVFTWNGIAGFYAKYPLKVPVGEPVRLYVLNMTEYEPVGSFHLHAQTFDVLGIGTTLTPVRHTDTVTLGQGERAILEFSLPELGRYMFHPHQHRIAEAGAMGWLAAV